MQKSDLNIQNGRYIYTPACGTPIISAIQKAHALAIHSGQTIYTVMNDITVAINKETSPTDIYHTFCEAVQNRSCSTPRPVLHSNRVNKNIQSKEKGEN